MFAEEKPALQPLPLEPFRCYQFGERSVNLDGSVEVDAAYYSAPPGWIGRQAKVQWDLHTVRVLDPRTGQLLREHQRQERGRHRIPPEDQPAHMLPSTTRLLARCETAGPTSAHFAVACTAGTVWCRSGAFRASWRWLASTEPCWPTTVVQPHWRAASRVTRIASSAAGWSGKPQLTLRQVDPMIRQLTLYRDLIADRTQENS